MTMWQPVPVPSVSPGVQLRNAMTVDVEDYFQVQAFERTIDRGQWDKLEHRVAANTDRVLRMFAEHNVKATFFTLGWVAQRWPVLVRSIVECGHELASHGMAHVRATDQTADQFRADVRDAKALLQDVSGAPVVGYRAASFSIGKRNLWALDVLAEEGYRYSSSIYPIRHDHYGMPDAPRFPFRPNPDHRLLEVPVTTVHLGGRTFPSGGGGYFRLFPYSWSRWALRRVNEQDGQPGMFYFHPWEIDPEQPRQNEAPRLSRFRHYVNLDVMESKMRRLLSDFNWGRMDEIFLPQS